MTDTTSPLFQATAPITNLIQETASSGQELLHETAQVGKDLSQGIGEFMSEPSQIFQPTKAVSTLSTFTQNVASF
jgi:hypothetical protein